MQLIKMYRVEYTFQRPRLELAHPSRPGTDMKLTIGTFTVVNEKVISDSEVNAVRDGLADDMILQHLSKRCMQLVHWEVREL